MSGVSFFFFWDLESDRIKVKWGFLRHRRNDSTFYFAVKNSVKVASLYNRDWYDDKYQSRLITTNGDESIPMSLIIPLTPQSPRWCWLAVGVIMYRAVIRGERTPGVFTHKATVTFPVSAYSVHQGYIVLWQRSSVVQTRLSETLQVWLHCFDIHIWKLSFHRSIPLWNGLTLWRDHKTRNLYFPRISTRVTLGMIQFEAM